MLTEEQVNLLLKQIKRRVIQFTLYWITLLFHNTHESKAACKRLYKLSNMVWFVFTSAGEANVSVLNPSYFAFLTSQVWTESGWTELKSLTGPLISSSVKQSTTNLHTVLNYEEDINTSLTLYEDQALILRRFQFQDFKVLIVPSSQSVANV